MSRDEVVNAAKRIVRHADVPRGARFVVIVTGEDGAFVGVAANTPHADATEIMRSALVGAELRFERVVDMPAEAPELTRG